MAEELQGRGDGGGGKQIGQPFGVEMNVLKDLEKIGGVGRVFIGRDLPRRAA
jgi:hypothetical protein